MRLNYFLLLDSIKIQSLIFKSPLRPAKLMGHGQFTKGGLSGLPPFIKGGGGDFKYSE